MLVWAGIQTPPLLKSPFLMFPKKSALTVSLLLFLCCLFSFCDIIPLSRIIWIYLTATFYALVYQNAFWEPSKNRCYTGRKQDTFIDAIYIDSYRFRCSLGSKVNQFHLEFCSFLYDLIPPVGNILASFRPPEGFNTFFPFFPGGWQRAAVNCWITHQTDPSCHLRAPPAPQFGHLITLMFFSASRRPPMSWARR